MNGNNFGSNIKGILKAVIVFLLCFLPTFLYQIIAYVVVFAASFGILFAMHIVSPQSTTEDFKNFYNSHLMDFSVIVILVTIPVMLFLWNRLLKYIKKKNAYSKYGPHNRAYYSLLLPVGYSAMMFGNMLVSTVQNYLPKFMVNKYETTNNILHTGSMFAIVISSVILAPIVEEILYRGIAYDFVKYVFNDKCAIFFTAVVFGIVHKNVVQGLYAGILGLVFGYIRYKYGNIYSTIFMHMLANGIVTALYYLSRMSSDGSHATEETSMAVDYIFAFMALRYGILLMIMLFLVHKFVKKKNVETEVL